VVRRLRAWASRVNRLLVVSCLGLAFLALACFIAYIVLPTAPAGWREFSLNLGTESTGILLTVVLIDAVIRGKESREQERHRRIALQQLYGPLNDHLRLLSNMYKASVERKPDREISSLQDLFSEDYFEQITYFNVLGPSPSAPPPMSPSAIASGNMPLPIPWYQYLSTEVNEFQDELGDVIDKYGRHLNPDTIGLLSQLSRSGFVNTVCRLPLEGNMSRGWGQWANNPFIMEPSWPQVRDHVRAFSELVDIYNEVAPDDRKLRIRGNIFSDNVKPAVGSSRAPYRILENGMRWIPPDPPPDQTPE
jgi:hypothetical protein